MKRQSVSRKLFSYSVALVAAAVVLFFWLRKDVQPRTKVKLTHEATARRQPSSEDGRPSSNVSEAQASEIRAHIASLRTRLPYEPAPRPELPEEERVIHGMTPEERRERGFTRMRLFASRSGGRMAYLANALETIGQDDLAARIKVLSKAFAQAQRERDEDKVAWGDLLTEQAEVLNECIRVAIDGETDSKVFRALVARSFEDVENAMSGNLESVDRKIEEELSESRDKDEIGEPKDGAEATRDSGRPARDGEGDGTKSEDR
jgi:hypothetical protein